jgi:hypothetical protein
LLPENKEEYDKRWAQCERVMADAKGIAHEICGSFLFAEELVSPNEDQNYFFLRSPSSNDHIKIKVRVDVWVDDDDYLELPED